MTMKKILSKHKNTIVSILGMLFFVYSTYLFLTKQITFTDYGAYLGSAGGMIATIIGFIAPDGKFSKKDKDEKNIVDEPVAHSCPKCVQDDIVS